MHPVWSFGFLFFSIFEFWSVLNPGWPSVVPVLVAFVLVPILDAIIGLNTRNASKEEEARWSKGWVWGPALYLYSISHFAFLYLGTQASLELPWWVVLASAVSTGIYTGGFGITAAHELAHKRDKASRFTANALLVTVWYQHFYVEHVRGHHLRVATVDDPASARKGEGFYEFLPRTLKGSFVHAYQIEAKRLGGFSFRNQVILGILASLILTISIAYMGVKALAFFLVQAVVAFTLLELVNYVEHYGLSRRRLENGRYEIVRPNHSWNSSHWFSNSLLFNLQRHSDHHAAAHLPFTVIKHHDTAPQLPSGYPGMIVLALIPPLWFKVMDPKLTDYQHDLEVKSPKAAG